MPQRATVLISSMSAVSRKIFIGQGSFGSLARFYARRADRQLGTVRPLAVRAQPRRLGPVRGTPLARRAPAATRLAARAKGGIVRPDCAVVLYRENGRDRRLARRASRR